MGLRESRVAFVDFLERVMEKGERLKGSKGRNLWFRGQSRSDFGLLPSLFRPSVEKASSTRTAAPGSYDVFQLESDLFFEFQAQAMNLDGRNISTWDLMFLMRHYSLPTRTLDWSETLAVAVYFAMSSEAAGKSISPTVWLLCPETLNHAAVRMADSISPIYLGGHLWGTRPIDLRWKESWERENGGSLDTYDYADLLASDAHRHFRTRLPLAVYPSRRNERMLAQQASFTIHCKSHEPLEKLCPSAVTPVPIPPKAWKGAEAFLEESGTNPRVLFPGLEGLSREMRMKYWPGANAS